MEEQFTIQLMYRGSIQEIVIKVKNNATLQRYFTEEYEAYGDNKVEVTKQTIQRLNQIAEKIQENPQDEDLVLGYLPPGLELMELGQAGEDFYLLDVEEIEDVTSTILELEDVLKIQIWSNWEER